jgi:Cys-rich repeat protein
MRCVECLTTANCMVAGGGGAMLQCDTTTNTCVECLMTSQCPMGRVCTADHICMAM